MKIQAKSTKGEAREQEDLRNKRNAEIVLDILNFII